MTFTWSNRDAFGRMQGKLIQLIEQNGGRGYPEGTAWVVVNHKSFGEEERDSFYFERLVLLAEMGEISAEHRHFVGWDQYRAACKWVGEGDTFGSVMVKLL